MGYRSDVRIRLTKRDYEKMKTKFEKEVGDTTGFNLFDDKILDVYKEINNFSCWKMTDDGEDIEEAHDCVFFGWNWIKWYEGCPEIDFVMNFLDECDQYAFCRIGECGEGDIETHERNMDMIGFHYVFDDEEE